MSTQVFTLANQLTILRMLLVPVFVLLTLYGRSGWALLTFMFAGMTDLLDGLAARKTSGKTDLGAWLDPIADKIMVAAVILVLAAQGVLTGPFVGDLHVIAGLVILIREIAVSGLREFLGGLRVSVPVSRLAKWKTTFQMVSLGALILGKAMPGWNFVFAGFEANVPHTVGLTTLWAAAALTLITGWDYLRVGIKHMD